MSTYTQILYHIVFSTKHRAPCMYKPGRERLFRYMWGVLKQKNCFLYRINGVDDHLHILTHLHPSVPLAKLVQDLKVSSNYFIKENQVFSQFEGWQEGYGAFTVSYRGKDAVINYIKRQETHHQQATFKQEYIRLLKQHGIRFEEKYLL